MRGPPASLGCPTLNERPQARSTGLVTESVGDELVVYDLVTRGAHCLSADAAGVWELCDGRRSPEDMAQELCVAAEQVSRALDELGDAGLLDSVLPAEPRLSRRDAAKRFAAVGAAAMSTPLIYSVAIPAAASAASGTQTGPGGPPDLCAGKDCDDNNACTIDECDPNTGNCINTPIVCDDGNPCTRDVCDPQQGCVFTPVEDGTSCGDQRYCQSGVCVAAP